MSDVDSGATNDVAQNQGTGSSPDDKAPVPTPGQGASAPSAPDVKADSSTAPADGAAKEPKGREPDEKSDDKPKGGFQKRIAELTRRASEAERDRERLLGLLERTAPQGARQPEPAGDDGPPQQSQFNTYEEYLDARADWRADQRVKAVLKESQDQTSARQQQESFGARVAQFNAEVAKEGKDIEGFAEAHAALLVPPQDGGPEVSPVMADYLTSEAENRALLVKFLGENPDEATKLSRLNPRTQLTRLARLDAQVGAKPQARTSNAPPPPPTVAGNAPPAVDLSKVDMDEYAKHWHARQAARRTR